MDQISDKRRKGIAWGFFASVALHVLTVAVFFVKLPDLPKAEEEETVNVDLVPPPEEKPKDNASEEKLKAEAQKPPEPTQAAKPPAKLPTVEKSAVKVMRPVFEFGPKDTAPKELDQREARIAATRSEGAPLAERPLSRTEQSKPAESQLAARPVPQDITLPAVDVTEVHSESKGPEAKGTGDNKTELGPVKPPKPDEAQATAPPESANVQPGEDSELTEATTLFTKDALSDPVARTAIGDLPRGERFNELCISELKEQLKHSPRKFRPIGFPGYPPSEGTVLKPKRGEFLHDGRWYNVRFKCEVNDDATKIVSFSYSVGGVVPKEEYKRRGISFD